MRGQSPGARAPESDNAEKGEHLEVVWGLLTGWKPEAHRPSGQGHRQAIDNLEQIRKIFFSRWK